MGDFDLDDSHYDKLLYGSSQNNDSETETQSFESALEEELDQDLQEAALSHLHFVPIDSFHVQKSPLIPSSPTSTSTSSTSPSTSSSFSNRSSPSPLHLSSPVSPSFTTKKLSLERSNLNTDDSRYAVFHTRSPSKPELIEILASSDDESTENFTSFLPPESSSSSSFSSSSSSISSSVTTQPTIFEPTSNGTTSTLPFIQEPLPHHTINTSDISKSLQNQSNQKNEDFSKWDKEFYKINTRYWLTEDELRHSKRSRTSYHDDYGYDVTIPCLKCKKDHDRKYNCKVVRCQACMELDAHSTYDCPFFAFPKCAICHLRFHDEKNCPMKRTPSNLCTKCPNLPNHSPEHCPRLWRVYVASKEVSEMPTHIRKSCSYCGHPHYFDGCTSIPRQKKFQSPWNKLALEERQATILYLDTPESYILSDFVKEILETPHPFKQSVSSTTSNHDSFSKSSSYSSNVVSHTTSYTSSKTYPSAHTYSNSNYASKDPSDAFSCSKSFPSSSTYRSDRSSSTSQYASTHRGSLSKPFTSTLPSYSNPTLRPHPSSSAPLQAMFPDRSMHPSSSSLSTSTTPPMNHPPWSHTSSSTTSSSSSMYFKPSSTMYPKPPPLSTSNAPVMTMKTTLSHSYPYSLGSQNNFKYPSVHDPDIRSSSYSSSSSSRRSTKLSSGGTRHSYHGGMR